MPALFAKPFTTPRRADAHTIYASLSPKQKGKPILLDLPFVAKSLHCYAALPAVATLPAIVTITLPSASLTTRESTSLVSSAETPSFHVTPP